MNICVYCKKKIYDKKTTVKLIETALGFRGIDGIYLHGGTDSCFSAWNKLSFWQKMNILERNNK